MIITTGILTTVSPIFATNYDQLAEDLTNSILTQILNDIPPTVSTTGDSETTEPTTSIVEELHGEFSIDDDRFLLTNKALNSRLNGWILTKDTTAAIDYLYQQKLTKYNTLQSFQSDNHLRRDEAAKFFSLFAKQVVKSTADTTKACSFKDLDEWHSDLIGDITVACQLGIFRGSNGYFNPTGSLTNAEALTVLMRIVYGPMSETDSEHRAKNYRQKAQSYGLTQWTLIDSMDYLDKPITRGDIARLLEAARFVPLAKKTLGGDISYSLSEQGFVRAN